MYLGKYSINANETDICNKNCSTVNVKQIELL